MGTKHLLCNSCNRTFLDTKGGGRCPYCQSFDVEEVGSTDQEMDPPVNYGADPLPVPAPPSPPAGEGGAEVAPVELADWLVYL